MAHGPGEQDAYHHYLDGLGAEQFNLGLSAVYVYPYLLDAFHLIGGHFPLLKEILLIVIRNASKVVLNHICILLPLTVECLFQYLLVIWQIVQQQLPRFAPIPRLVGGDATPGQGSELVQVDYLGLEHPVEFLHPSFKHAALDFFQFLGGLVKLV